MKFLFLTIILIAFAGCSDPVEQLRNEAVESFPEFWTEKNQIELLRKKHDIPTSYAFKDAELVGFAESKDSDYGLYEWSFRFGATYEDLIEIRMICYYDTDSVVLHDVKTERIHWVDADIKSRSFSFRGIEDE